MNLKIYEKEIIIYFQISDENGFLKIFNKLREDFELGNFKKIARVIDSGPECVSDGKENFICKAKLPFDSDSRDGTKHFCVTILTSEKERFYTFIRDFCEEHDVTFETSTSEILNDPEKITFEYDGKTYVVKGDAYDKNLIRLPNGKILKVGSWIKSFPPQPGEIEDVTDKFSIAEEI